MRIYSARNLLAGFAIVIVLMLAVTFYTFSNLRLQSKELTRISRAREVLQTVGNANKNFQEMAVFREGDNRDDTVANSGYIDLIGRLRQDSINFKQLASSEPNPSRVYDQLSALSGKLIETTDAPGADRRTRIGFVRDFNRLTAQLEEQQRAILESSYQRSSSLTREAITLVTIIVMALAIFLILSFTFIYYDIRHRKAKEERLKRFNVDLEKKVSEQTRLVREVFERVSDGFIALDKNWRYTYMNNTAGKILHRDPAKMIGRHIWEESPEAVGLPFHEAYERAMATQEYMHLEEYYPPSDRWFENNIYPSEHGLSIYFRDITERKKTEEAIRANEEELKLIYHTTTDIIFLVKVISEKNDYRFTFRSVNKAFLISTGLQERQVIDRDVNDVIPEPSAATMMEKYKQAIKARRPVEWEETSLYPAGRKTGLVTASPVFNKNNKCTLLVVVIHDITIRKKAEKELELAEAKFRSLVEQSLIGVYIIQNGKFMYVNPRLAEIFGYRQQELIGVDPLTVIAQKDQSMVAEQIRLRLEGEVESLHYEAMGRSKDGREVPIEIYCAGSLLDAESAIMGTLLDITERKEAEDSILVANERYQLIAKATNDIVWDWDMVKDINRGNDVFYQYYGLAPGEVCDNKAFISRVHPDDRERITAKLQKAIEKGEDVVVDEFRFRIPDGSYRHFYDRAYIIYGAYGKPVRMLGSMIDITEKMQLEKEISEQKVQAQKMITRAVLQAEERERNKMGQELHDNVNQILVSAKMFLSLLAKTGDSDRAEKLLSDSTRMVEQAIQEIRSLSQNQVTPLKEAGLDELIRLLIFTVRETSGLSVKYENKVSTLLMEEDIKLNIYRIIQEQVNNVMKHAEATELEIILYEDNKHIHAVIADNGKGFDLAKQRMGIGISNMINRVESFNGELSIRSSPGLGCRLSINIPLDV
jgi:PAS domain S-box-containing protein